MFAAAPADPAQLHSEVRHIESEARGVGQHERVEPFVGDVDDGIARQADEVVVEVG